MKKSFLSKFVSLLVSALLITVLCVAMIGCGGTTGDSSGTTDDPADDYVAPAGSTVYTFEAEHTDLDGVTGEGWSGGASGTAMILTDYGTYGASNEFYIGYLYVENTTLTFEIESDADVDDAVLVLRLSGEGSEDGTLKFASDGFSDEEDEGYTAGSAVKYTVEVNDEAVDYDTIQMYNLGAEAVTSNFYDYTINTSVSLKKGTNTIELITDNTMFLQGTATSTAPVVDCIKISTTAGLSWTPITSNEPEIE